MPIYAYKCSSCGHTQDVLQKLSAAPLTDCPACGQATYSKQVTAPQFQLKGSGWYVTDFKGGASGAKDSQADDKAEPANAEAKPAAPADAKSETKTESGAACPVHSAPAVTPNATPAKPAAS
ncbi:MAG: FmdB family zinc ribbon protein, partial [Betaproteobacteria bacterium]